MPDERIGLIFEGPEGERYQLLQFLGHGGFGEVFRAVGLTTGKVVAVKFIIRGAGDQDLARADLLTEARLASCVRHPNVVQVLHVGQTSEEGFGPYIVMELISGGTLKDLFDKTRRAGTTISIDRARQIFLDVASGAKAINERLIHRDIKPDNIFIEGDRFKIGDFGLSKIVDARIRTRTFKGGQHVCYMAPEAWELRTNTIALDVYSVGLVFYEILLLDHPLKAAVESSAEEFFSAWRNAHLFGRVPDLGSARPDTSPSMVQLLSRMIAKRPQDRPDWDDVIMVVNQADKAATASGVASLLSAALARREKVEKEKLAEAQNAEKEEQKSAICLSCCKAVVERFDGTIAEFNAESQVGQIEIRNTALSGREYRLPFGGRVRCEFFGPPPNPLPMGNRLLIGGAYLGAENGTGGNLLLLREGADDLYGAWSGCRVKISPIADPHAVIGNYGVTLQTVQPFGFENVGDFYKEVIWAAGGLHIFSYEFPIEVGTLFREILLSAFQD